MTRKYWHKVVGILLITCMQADIAILLFMSSVYVVAILDSTCPATYSVFQLVSQNIEQRCCRLQFNSNCSIRRDIVTFRFVTAILDLALPVRTYSIVVSPILMLDLLTFM